MNLVIGCSWVMDKSPGLVRLHAISVKVNIFCVQGGSVPHVPELVILLNRNIVNIDNFILIYLI